MSDDVLYDGMNTFILAGGPKMTNVKKLQRPLKKLKSQNLRPKLEKGEHQSLTIYICKKLMFLDRLLNLYLERFKFF